MNAVISLTTIMDAVISLTTTSKMICSKVNFHITAENLMFNILVYTN